MTTVEWDIILGKVIQLIEAQMFCFAFTPPSVGEMRCVKITQQNSKTLWEQTIMLLAFQSFSLQQLVIMQFIIVFMRTVSTTTTDVFSDIISGIRAAEKFTTV
jgi:hypothetical protein